jgi:hypothetical protein
MGRQAITTAVTAVAGLLLAVATAFGVASATGGTPDPVDEPIVLYGER